MVSLAALLGSTIAELLLRGRAVSEVVYCSNLGNMSAQNTIPFSRNDEAPTTGPENYPGATLDKVRHLNYALVIGAVNVRTGPGAAGGALIRPCTTWYEEDYPLSDLYEKDPKAKGPLLRDASFVSSPLGGWFSTILSGLAKPNQTDKERREVFANLNIFLNYQLKAGSLYSFDPSVKEELIGVRTIPEPEKLQDFLGIALAANGGLPPGFSVPGMGAPGGGAPVGNSTGGTGRPGTNSTLERRQTGAPGGPPSGTPGGPPSGTPGGPPSGTPGRPPSGTPGGPPSGIPGGPPGGFPGMPGAPPALPIPPKFKPATKESNSLFSTIPTRYYLDLETTGSVPGVNGLIPIPWYNKTGSTDDDLDNAISEALQVVIREIAKLDKSKIQSQGEGRANAAIRIQKSMEYLPHGAIYFKKIDHEKLQYSWNYHYGSDRRIKAASNFPAEGLRLMYQQTQLGNSILRNSNTSGLGNAQITHGFRIMPELKSTKFNIPLGSLLGAILYPFGVSFLLPIFVVILVQEKEFRILVMMKMNGMKSWAYYLSHYVTFLVLFVVSSSVFFFTGYITKLSLFTLTDPTVLATVLFVWGNNQISLAFLFSTLFDKSRIALVVSYLFVLCSVIVSFVTDQLFVDSSAPLVYFFWPPFAFYRLLGLMNFATVDASKIPYRTSDMFSGSEFSQALICMIVAIPICFLLAGYLDAIFPSEFGVKRPWHFPISSWLEKSDKKLVLSGTVATDAVETKFEDDDVRNERARVCDPNFDDSKYPLVMKNMRKVFGGRGGAGPKLAVKDVSFAVEEGITFGLLGPNGAVFICLYRENQL
jgi:hypothetical protein